MTIPFFDLSAAYKELKVEIDAAISRVLASGWYILGEEVASFEAAFARYCEADYAVGVANGLDALILSLRALGIEEGDEVIVPSNTFIATWLAVSELGAIPVPVEPDASTHNIDPGLLDDAITSKTRAVIAVHLYGQPADLDAISEITRAKGLKLIEDAAQAQGARYRGQRIGAYGDAVCWSFYPAKNLGAVGDGGAVTTNDFDLAQKIRTLGNYGSREKYYNEVRGKNSRLDPLQAAILAVKLPVLDEWNDRRRIIAKQYISELATSTLTLPVVREWAEPVWHQFVVRSPTRNELIRELTEAGVPTQIHYPLAPSQQKAYTDLKLRRPLPIAEGLAGEVFSLPIGPHQSDETTKIIINKIREVCEN